MKTPNWTKRGFFLFIFLFFFAVLFSASAVSAIEIVRNGDFESGFSDWNVSPGIAPSWNPLSEGAISLNPPSGDPMEYTGPVIHQNLNVTNIAGKTLRFSMDLIKINAYNDNTVLVELSYATTSDTIEFIEIGMPPVADISSDPANPTTITEDIVFPADAEKLFKIEVFKENTGDFISDNISLFDATDSVSFGALPQISGVSSDSGAYGSSLIITGANFGATQGLVSIGGSADGVSVTSWSDTSVEVMVNDPARSGRVRVISDYVESNIDFSFEVTSPNYTVYLKNDDLSVVKGQAAEYTVVVDFLNDFDTIDGITFSIDPGTMPAGAVVDFTPVPLTNTGGVLMKVDTAGVSPGDYSILLKADEANTADRYVPFLLEVTTIESINFSQWVYDPQTSTNNEVNISQIDLTTQGSFSVDIKAIDSLGNTWTTADAFDTGIKSPLALSSSNPSVLFIEPTTWGPNYYALAGGSANIVVNATDGTQATLPVNIVIGENAPQVQASISPTSVPYSYTGDLTFSATGNYALTNVGTSSSGMVVDFRSTFSDNGSWYDGNMSYASTFKLGNNDGSQQPGAFTVIFSATTTDGTTSSTGCAPLQVTADPALAQITGGVLMLDDMFAEHFILEFYDSFGTKAFEREIFMYHKRDFHLVGIQPGDYRLKLVHEDYTGIRTFQWYPNADTMEGAQALSFNGGATTEDVYFFLSQGPAVSFTGLVRASDVNSPIDGTPIPGAGVYSADNWNISTSTDASGAFTLGGLPINNPFALQITATDYVTVYSQTINTPEDVIGLWPFVMFTSTELAGWPIDILPSGTGFVTGRVVDGANPSQPVEGVKVTYTSANSGAYNVAYFDGTSFTSGETATTSANGLYYIYGIAPGDAISVQGTKDGWTFQGPAFHSIHSDSVHEGLILGTSATTALAPDVMYMRFDQGYQLELILEGDVTGITSVTVTGPANSGIVDFPLTGEYDEFWDVYPSDTAFITTGFPENYAGIYTFHINYSSSSEDITFDFQPGTPGALPADVNVNPAGILSWGPNAAVDHYYYKVFNNEGHEVRNTEDGPPLYDTYTVNLYSLLGAYEQAAGSYSAQLVAVYPSGNESYSDPVTFNYNEGDEDKGYITGGVDCQDWTATSGAIHVIAYTDATMQSIVSGLEDVINEIPSSFFIFGFNPGQDYYVAAYLDSNGNSRFDEGEPFAASPNNPIQVTAMSQTNAGAINLAAGTSGISFSGRLVDSAGNGLEGAEVSWADNFAMTTTGTDGSFTLDGLPVDSPFTLYIWGSEYVDVYSPVIRSSVDINNSDIPFVLFTPAETAGWNIDTGKGVITGRIWDISAQSGVQNAVVSCVSMLGQDYTVQYPGSTTGSTAIDGKYMIPNVLDGDMVVVTATYSGFAFNGRVFRTYADSVSEGYIFGTTSSDVLALRTAFDEAMVLLNAKDLDGFMAYISESYLDDGQNKAGFRAELTEEFSDPLFEGESCVVLGSFIDGDVGQLTVLWDDMEREELIFRKENGSWRLYGNQALFEVMARSGYQAQSFNPVTYWVSLEVEDPGDVITSVTVTGNGISGALTLYHDTDEHEWNSWHQDQNPTFGNIRPELPLTYTFTINYGTDLEKTETETVNDFVEVMPMDPSPWEGQTISGDPVFSWTPVPGYEHGIEIMDMNWNRVWEQHDVQGLLVDGQVRVVYGGPDLEGGNYRYNIVTSDSDGNYSLLQTGFFYAEPGPVPNLGMAILALQALTGMNPGGLEAIQDIDGDGAIGPAEVIYVIQTNAGLITPLPVTSTSGTATLISRAWNDNDGFDFSAGESTGVQIIDDLYDWKGTDFIVETNIIFLAPGVEAQDLGVLSLSEVNRVPISGYSWELDVVLNPGHVYAFRMFDGTYAAIQFSEIATDPGDGTTKSIFNYKFQPVGTTNF